MNSLQAADVPPTANQRAAIATARQTAGEAMLDYRHDNGVDAYPSLAAKTGPLQQQARHEHALRFVAQPVLEARLLHERVGEQGQDQVNVVHLNAGMGDDAQTIANQGRESLIFTPPRAVRLQPSQRIPGQVPDIRGIDQHADARCRRVP